MLLAPGAVCEGHEGGIDSRASRSIPLTPPIIITSSFRQITGCGCLPCGTEVSLNREGRQQ